ncbi:MAG: diguanylate cyclase domain-containing protein, partial [Nitrospiria bacterium]
MPLFKRALFYFLPALCLVLLIIYGFYIQEVENQRSRFKSEAYYHLSMISEEISHELHEVGADLQVLLGHAEFPEALDTGNPVHIQALAEEFLVFAKARNWYAKIRLIDQSGLELIRVDHDDVKSQIIAKAQLQNKRHRYYFKETMALQKGAVYVSPFDLNRENGEVEPSAKPVIRFSAPATDRQGENAGLLILNVRGDTLLRELEEHRSVPYEGYLFVNGKDFFFRNRLGEDAWEIDYQEGPALLLQRNFPDIGERILNAWSGQFYSEIGLVTFSSINPYHGVLKGMHTSSANDGSEKTNTPAKARIWKFLTVIPAHVIAAEERNVLNKYILIMVAMDTLLAVGATFLAKVQIHREATLNTLKESEARLFDSQKTAKLGHYVFDIKAGTWTNSAELDEIFGIDEDYHRNTAGWLQIVHPDWRDRMSSYLEDNVLTRHQNFDKTYQILDIKTGAKKWVHGLGRLAFDDNLHPVEMFGTIQDITPRKEAEIALLESKEKYRSIFHSLTVAMVVVVDGKGRIIEWNEGAKRAFGYSETEALGQPFSLIIPERFIGKPAQGFSMILKNVHSDTGMGREISGLRKDGREFPLEIVIGSWERAGELFFSAIMLDITQRKQAEKELLYQAHFDSLTDLPNRFLALDRLSQLLNEAQRSKTLVAVLFLDLDDFKKVNDTLGHETGDALLIQAAERLRRVSRRCDTVGRLGGDEFIVLVGGLSGVADIRPVARNLLDLFRTPFTIKGREITLTTSVGIAVSPMDGDQPSQLLRNADSAMYHAKALGRNTCAYFTAAMNEKVSRRLLLEEQMRHALASGEFNVFYQPQLDVSRGRVSGAEALLRWRNPLLGNVSPEEFIPIAEETGLIVPLGKFVLTTALELLARLRRGDAPGFRMAVNLSPRQFRDPDLVPFVVQSLDRAGVPGECLELEITEGVLMRGDTEVNEALAAFSNLGVKIAMDDFGTGYS